LIIPSGRWTERYEALRAQAADGPDGHRGWGLALASRQGVAAWMRAWPAEALPAPPLPPCVADPATAIHSLPDSLRGQIALVMADMILTHQQEIRA
jgi:hypothetical protein